MGVPHSEAHWKGLWAPEVIFLSNAIHKSFLSVSKELRLYLEPLQARGKDKGSAAETPLSEGLQEIFMTLTRTLK